MNHTQQRPAASYWGEFSERFGSGWNQFWFTPADPWGVCVLRWFAGTLAFWFVLSFTADLTTWFGPDGLLPVETVARMTRQADGRWNARASYFYHAQDSASLYTLHGAGLCVALAFTAGLATRVTSVLTLAVVLSYIHRAPMVMGAFEPVLTMILFYLCFAPCGACLSLDSWLRRIRQRKAAGEAAGKASASADQPAVNPSLAAGICLRLIQVHAAALYAMMALTKLGGSVTWWAGEAVWWLLARSESRLVDWTGLADNEYLINFWTHAILAFELGFALLIWNRWARPLLLAISVPHWLLIGLITGQLSFAAAMLAVNLAFIPPASLRHLCGQLPFGKKSASTSIAAA